MVAAGEGDGKMWDLFVPEVIKESCPYLQRSISFRNDILTLHQLRKLYRKYKPDVIHLHSSKAGALGRIAFPTSKIVYTVHGFDSVRLAFRKFLLVERILQHCCRSIVSVSRYDMNNLVKERIHKNISVIPNGIALPKNKEIKDVISLSSEKKVVLTIARTDSPKRPDIFIEIARAMPEYEFVWIGNLKDQYRRDMPDNCHFVGNLTGAGGYCSSVDLFVLISDYEGLPMSIIEAMSCSKPIVASNVGGVAELVINQQNGFVVPNEVNAFVAKIRYILSSASVTDSMGQASYSLFSREFTIEKMVQGYLNVYRNK